MGLGVVGAQGLGVQGLGVEGFGFRLVEGSGCRVGDLESGM